MKLGGINIYEFVEAFEAGYKPVVWLISPLEDVEINRLKEKYLYSTSDRKNIQNDNYKDFIDYWFFQNKEDQAHFDKEVINDIITKGKFDDEKIGMFLGFPPAAIRNFAKLQNDKDCGLYEKRVGVDYAGIRFMSYEDSILEDLKWLKNNLGIPLENEAHMGINFMGDTSKPYFRSSHHDDKGFKEMLEKIENELCNKVVS